MKDSSSSAKLTGKHSKKNEGQIVIYNRHVARIPTNLYLIFRNDLKEKNVSVTEWVSNQSKKEFGIELTCAADLDKLDHNLEEAFYKDRGDWLLDKIRHYLQKKI